MAELQQVKLSTLHESPFNPRQKFDGLDELAESIRANGIIQPLIVRRVGDNGAGFEIIAGARRYRAAKLAKQDTVPVLVRDLNDTEARTEQILENLQREDIAPLEEAAAYQALLESANKGKHDTNWTDDMKLGVEGLAKRVGKSKRYVYARLELLKLSAPVQKALGAGKIEASHAQELVPLKPEQQKELLGAIETEQKYGRSMSVEDVRDEIATRYREKPAPPKLSAKEKARREREQAAQKKRDLAWKHQQAKTEAEKKIRAIVDARANSELWAKLKATRIEDREWLIDRVLEVTAEDAPGIQEALALVEGKTAPRVWFGIKHLAKFTKRARVERIGLLVLAHVIDRGDYNPKSVEQFYRRFHVDRKAIAKRIQTEQKAAAAKASAKVQTSAKAAPRGKAKAKRAA